MTRKHIWEMLEKLQKGECYKADVMDAIDAYDEASDKHAIALVAEGEYALMKIEVEKGKWLTMIKERLDSPFSHIIEPMGIQRAFEAYHNLNMSV